VTELKFEWDQNKAAQNLAKHGVSFLTAAAIFANEIVEGVDDREDSWPRGHGDLSIGLHVAERRRDPDHQRAEGEQT
jgi:uncharacterized DUF497 family protein